MFAPDGTWQEETFNQPGGGAAAGLDIMNATQSYQNYKRAREAGVLATMLKMRNEGDAGHDVSQTPEGGQALSTLGVDPQSIDTMWQNEPEQQFSRAISEMPDEQQTPENLQKTFLSTGGKYKDWAANENRFGGLKIRSDREKDTARKNFSKSIEDAFKTNVNVSDSLDDAVERTVGQVRAGGLSEDEDRQLTEWQEATKGKKIGGKEAAVVEETNAKTGLAKAKAKATLDTLQPRINVLNAHATLMKAQTLRQQALAEHANGTSKLTPKDCLNYAAKSEKMALDASKLADNSLDQVGKAKAMKTAEGFRQEAREWKAKAQELNSTPAAAPAPAKAADKKAPPAAGPADGLEHGTSRSGKPMHRPVGGGPGDWVYD